MPVVLMQRAWHDDPQYKDTEFAVYHYPEVYFGRISGGERFVYYRPSRGAKAGEASTYFGCGVLGEPFVDPDDPSHRYVDITVPIRFAQPVPFVVASTAPGRFAGVTRRAAGDRLSTFGRGARCL